MLYAVKAGADLLPASFADRARRLFSFCLIVLPLLAVELRERHEASGVGVNGTQ